MLQSSIPQTPLPTIAPLIDVKFPSPGRGSGAQMNLQFDPSSSRLMVRHYESKALVPHPRVLCSYVGSLALAVCLLVALRSAHRMWKHPNQVGRVYCRHCGYELGDSGNPPPPLCSECGTDTQSTRAIVGKSFLLRLLPLSIRTAIAASVSVGLIAVGVERRPRGEITWPVDGIQRLYPAWPLMPARTPIDVVERVHVLSIPADGSPADVVPLKIRIESLSPPVFSTDGNNIAWIEVSPGPGQPPQFSTVDLRSGKHKERPLPKSPKGAQVRLIGIRGEGLPALFANIAASKLVNEADRSQAPLETVNVNLFVWDGGETLKLLHTLDFDAASASGVASGVPAFFFAFRDGTPPRWAIAVATDRGLRDVRYGDFDRVCTSTITFPNWRHLYGSVMLRDKDTLVCESGTSVSLPDGIITPIPVVQWQVDSATFANRLVYQKGAMFQMTLATPAQVVFEPSVAVSPDGRLAAAVYRRPEDTPFGPFGVLVWRLPVAPKGPATGPQ